VEDKPVIAEILMCPGCNSDLRLTGDEWTCPSCGLVAVQRSNVVDFLYNTPQIELANNGKWDLSEDQRTGVELLRLSETHGYSELKSQARDLRTGEGRVFNDPHAQLLDSRLAKFAQRRFARRYEQVSSEVGRGHGQQMLHKIETRLRDIDLPSVPSELAVELGGGDGQYILGFAKRFRHVLFLDGSLVNLALASALARDDGVTNVSFLRVDITALPVRSSIASMVHANGVIEHVNDPAALVAETVRVRSQDGYSVVVSPNRTPITFEPHFRLPLFGLIPRFIRTPLIGIARGKASEAGTDLLTIRRLKQTLQRTNAIWDVFVIPRGVDSTARQTPLRSIAVKLMQSPLGSLADKLINHFLLPIAHSHIAIGRRDN
jgi:ubiquinone/menaquinone biosynthesis C-methylase UbiE